MLSLILCQKLTSKLIPVGLPLVGSDQNVGAGLPFVVGASLLAKNSLAPRLFRSPRYCRDFSRASCFLQGGKVASKNSHIRLSQLSSASIKTQRAAGHAPPDRDFQTVTAQASARVTTPGCMPHSCLATASPASRWPVVHCRYHSALQWLGRASDPAVLQPHYLVHRHLGHQTCVRTAVLRTPRAITTASLPRSHDLRQPRDWRVILSAWLIVLHSLAITPCLRLLSQLSPNVAAVCRLHDPRSHRFTAFHACEHLPAEHPVARLPWIRQMHRLHACITVVSRMWA